MSIAKNLDIVKNSVPKGITLVAISKTHPVDKILECYNAGQKVFGENKVAELIEKKKQLPKDIEWHMVGHLQTNKVKHLLPHASLIHSVDSEKLLHEINKQSQKLGIITSILLQVFIASEETKFGFEKQELEQLLNSGVKLKYPNIKICGLMGMATFTQDTIQIKNEFKGLKSMFDSLREQYFDNEKDFSVLSMGMSSDYKIAISEGSNMVRVGSLIFGERNYGKLL